LTKGYSGREIERLIKEVLSRMLARENSQIIGMLKRDPRILTNEELMVSALTLDDFEKVTHFTRPETTDAVQKRFREWGK
jgi:hypothetical protein